MQQRYFSLGVVVYNHFSATSVSVFYFFVDYSADAAVVW